MQTFHEREAVIGEDSVLGMKNELITHYVLLPKYCILTLPTAMWKNHFFVRQLLGNIGVLLIYGDFGYVSPNDATYPVLITCCLNFQGFLVDVKVDLLIMALRKFLTSSRLFFPSLPKFSSFSNAAQTWVIHSASSTADGTNVSGTEQEMERKWFKLSTGPFLKSKNFANAGDQLEAPLFQHPHVLHLTATASHLG